MDVSTYWIKVDKRKFDVCKIIYLNLDQGAS